MSSGVRAALLGLIALLLVILACLVVFALIIRRRSAQPSSASRGRRSSEHDIDALGLDFALDDAMACPACRREFEPALQFCPYDASRLVAASQMLEQSGDKRSSGRVCPSCRRAYEAGLRYCPHDGHDLVPMAVHQAVCEHEHVLEAADEIAKICPRCQGRYEFAASFCGKDGHELVVLN